MNKWTRHSALLVLVAAILAAMPAGAQDATTANLEHGKTLFFEEAGGIGCAACHGEDARGAIGSDIRGRSVKEIKAATNAVADMQAAGLDQLTNEEIDHVAAYLATLI